MSQSTEEDSSRPREEPVLATTNSNEQGQIVCDIVQQPVNQSATITENPSTKLEPVVAVRDSALPEATANQANEAVMEIRTEDKAENINPGIDATVQPIGEPGNETGNKVADVDGPDQTKMNVDMPDDEFDDEFDNDLWFDAACLKSFDALDTSTELTAKPEGEKSAEARAQPRASSMFQTAAGGLLADVSEAAKATVRSLLDQADQPQNQRGTSTTDVKEENHLDTNAIESFIDTRRPEQLKEDEIPATVGFSTARGKKVDILTTDVAAKNTRIAKLMQELMDIKNEAIVVEPTKETPKKASLFTALNGSPMAPISAFAESAVTSIFSDRETASETAVETNRVFSSSAKDLLVPSTTVFSRSENGPPATPVMPRRNIDTINGSGLKPMLNQEYIDYPLLPSNANVLSLDMPTINFETPVKAVSKPESSENPLTACDTPAASTVRSGSLQDISNLQPFTPSQQNCSKRFKSPFPSDMIPRASFMKPSQTPLLSRNGNSASPGPSVRKGMSPALPRRVGLGMTPRTRSSLVDRPKFVSPFKGVNDEDHTGDVGSPITKPRLTMRTIFSAPMPKKAIHDAPLHQHCFDLTCKSNE